MKLFVTDLLVAILNVLFFIIINNNMRYINLFIGCLCFICSGVELKGFVDKKYKDY